MKFRYILTNTEEYLIDQVSEKRKPIILWNILINIYFYIMYDIPRFYKRTLCRLLGCKVRGGSGGWNLPPEAYSYYCQRCGASESNFEGCTDYEIIYK